MLFSSPPVGKNLTRSGAGDKTGRGSKATVISYSQWKKNQPIIKARSLRGRMCEVRRSQYGEPGAVQRGISQ